MEEQMINQVDRLKCLGTIVTKDEIDSTDLKLQIEQAGESC